MTAPRQHDGERGVAPVIELLILAPVFMMLVYLVILSGRMLNARSAVDGAARDAVRAASLARSATGAELAASRAAAGDLAGGQRVRCASFAVATDTSRFAPGGLVTVTVTCRVPLADLALLGIPGAKTLSASYPAPIDTYRATG